MQVGECHWHIYTAGTGTHCLIALHGFGEAGDTFSDWPDVLGKAYTFIAVDLPYHGRATEWPDVGFQPGDFLELVDAIVAQFACHTYSLLGHSLGGRIVQCIWPDLKQTPDNIWLLAPDGLATRRMGILKLFPAGLRKWIAGKVGKQSSFWLGAAARLHQLGVIDAFSLRYLRYHLANPERRRRLMGVWTSLHYFPVNKEKLLQAALAESPLIHLVIGQKDALIDWQKIEGWLAQWPSDQLHVLRNEGHGLISPGVAAFLKERQIQDEGNAPG